MGAALWQFAGSLVAVAVLVLIAAKFGFTGAPALLDEEEARSLASEVPGGFDAERVTLDRSRSGALLRDASGRIALVAPAGAHFVARLLGPGAKVRLAGDKLTVRDASVVAALDLGPETDDWAKMLSALG